MTRMRLGVIALLWLLTVVVASTLTWTVISSAGARVGQPITTVTTAPGQVFTDAPLPGSTATPQQPETATPTPETPDASASVTRRPSASPTATRAPTKPPPTRTPSASATSRPTVTETWIGAAGRATVTCTGAKVSLANAVPEDGFAVKVEERGPERVKVEFESRRSDEDDEVKLIAGCAGGRPVFTQE